VGADQGASANGGLVRGKGRENPDIHVECRDNKDNLRYSEGQQ